MFANLAKKYNALLLSQYDSPKDPSSAAAYSKYIPLSWLDLSKFASRIERLSPEQVDMPPFNLSLCLEQIFHPHRIMHYMVDYLLPISSPLFPFHSLSSSTNTTLLHKKKKLPTSSSPKALIRIDIKNIFIRNSHRPYRHQNI